MCFPRIITIDSPMDELGPYRVTEANVHVDKVAVIQ